MRRVCTAAAVRARDHAVITQRRLPGRTLMELAGHGAAQAILARYPAGPVAILCGPGNNGGDGYVVARWLALAGRTVHLWAPRPPTTEDAQANAWLCAEQGLSLHDSPEAALDGAAVAVDALLGTGQASAPRGPIRDGVLALARATCPVVALDMPTGVDTDTGQPLGEAVVSAALTLTFGHWKRGLLAEPGTTLAGEVVLIDIGLELAPPLPAEDAWLLEAGDRQALADRLSAPDSQAKWHRGHVAIRAGGGAAVLAAHGAFRAGAGLVTVLAPRDEWPRMTGLWPEVILSPPDALDPRRHDALVLGPGLGVAAAQRQEVADLWRSWPGPLLADADALTLLGSTPHPRDASAGPRVVTPHSAEAARLLGTSRAAVEADRFPAAARLAQHAQGVAILKGPHSLIAAPGAAMLVSPVRCGRLATAGSGDVLAGLVGGLLARGLPPRDAATLGVLWHGQAGERMPPRGSAGDLLERLRELL